MSVLVGGYFLAKHCGGNGVLLGGVPGVLPGKVVVLGGGAAGINAARMAQGLGADVTILEVDLERMRFLDITLHTAHTLYSNEAHVMEILPTVDLLIGAVLVPGAKAPKLIRREMLRRMRPGSVLVDIAIDQGGCAETSRPTTHHDPVFTEEGVLHYCVANMPAAYARTATQALTNVTHRYIEQLADLGLRAAARALGRHQCAGRPGHLPRRRRRPRPTIQPSSGIAVAGIRDWPGLEDSLRCVLLAPRPPVLRSRQDDDFASIFRPARGDCFAALRPRPCRHDLNLRRQRSRWFLWRWRAGQGGANQQSLRRRARAGR